MYEQNTRLFVLVWINLWCQENLGVNRIYRISNSSNLMADSATWAWDLGSNLHFRYQWNVSAEFSYDMGIYNYCIINSQCMLWLGLHAMHGKASNWQWCKHYVINSGFIPLPRILTAACCKNLSCSFCLAVHSPVLHYRSVKRPRGREMSWKPVLI